MVFNTKSKAQESGESTPSEALSTKEKKPKRGTYLEDRMPSIRKVNAERDGRINFLAKANLLLALFLLSNVGFLSYRVTRTTPPSQTFVQYYAQAGIMVPVDTLSRAQLATHIPPIPRSELNTNIAPTDPAASASSVPMAPDSAAASAHEIPPSASTSTPASTTTVSTPRGVAVTDTASAR